MVTHGALDWVTRALDALAASTPSHQYELVIVDNASQDGTEALVRDHAAHAGRSIRTECCETNLGFAAGNNLAANLARGNVLCFLNSDAIVSPGWLDPLVAPLLA